MPAALTRSLGAFIEKMQAVAVPIEATNIARMGFIDCVGTMIAGRGEPATQILRKVLNPGPGEATLYFSELTAAAPEAAWINGTAAHALDFDDVGIRGHPSAVLVAALLAEGEAIGATGAQLLDAYVVGYEVWAELALRERGALHLKGWHPTAVWGAVGAAAACARLLKLDTAQSINAIALGASQSSGLMANFGTMTKPFHAGRSAHAGLISARLAANGFTASPDALEHDQGLMLAVSQKGETDRDTEATPGTRWNILKEGISIKKFPTCYCTHRAIDAMLALRQLHGLVPQDISEITVFTNLRFSKVLRNHCPQTALEAKFSMEFAVACAVIAGRVGLPELSDAFVQSDAVQRLMARVRIDVSRGHDSTAADSHDQVCVRLDSGAELSSEPVKRARGHFEVPLTERELQDKFELCLAAGGMAAGSATEIFARLRAMERSHAGELTAPTRERAAVPA
jgi:2-methylcitrate dehydratase PrpD